MRRLKKITSKIPIVILTGNCTEDQKQECLDPNGSIRAAFFYRKPISFAECKLCITTLLVTASKNPTTAKYSIDSL